MCRRREEYEWRLKGGCEKERGWMVLLLLFKQSYSCHTGGWGGGVVQGSEVGRGEEEGRRGEREKECWSSLHSEWMSPVYTLNSVCRPQHILRTETVAQHLASMAHSSSLPKHHICLTLADLCLRLTAGSVMSALWRDSSGSVVLWFRQQLRWWLTMMALIFGKKTLEWFINF